MPQISVKIGQADMTMQLLPPKNAEGREQQLEKLLTAMGLSEDFFARYALVDDLERIEHQYARWIALSRKQPDIDLIRRCRAAVSKALALSQEIGTDFLTNEIVKAGWSRLNPGIDEQVLHTLMTDSEFTPSDVVTMLATYGLDIDHWIEHNGANYKKRDLRKLVIEPVFRLMAEHGIVTSRKRPRKRIFDALFDWLGVERKYRPSSANIDQIARELESEHASNAKR